MKRTTKTIMAIFMSLLTVLGTTVVFAEDPVDISETAEVALAEENELVYDGTVQKPNIIVKNNNVVLTPDMDYTVEYPESINAGTYSVTVNYKGIYTGSSVYDYKIASVNATNNSDFDVKLSQTRYVYDGTAKFPDVTVTYGSTTLLKDTDYIVSYSNNIKSSTVASVKVKMQGNYTGSITKNFTIDKLDGGKFKVTLSSTSYTYDGKVKTPTVTVKDSKGKTLKKNVDYTISYAKGRKNVGKYAVKINFIGNYGGNKTVYFTIKPKGTSIKSVTAAMQGFTVKWNKQSNNTTGYQIQYSTSSKFTSPKYYTTTSTKTLSKKITKLGNKKTYYVRIRTYKKVGDTKILSSWSKSKKITTKGVNNVVSPSVKANYYGFDVKWSKTSSITNYQIKYSTDKNFKDAKFIKLSSKTTSKKVTDLAGGKTYYVAIRCLKTVKEGKKNVTYCGDYKKFTVTTKKGTEPATPNFKSLTAPKYKKLKLTWDKVDGASGYVIEYKANYKTYAEDKIKKNAASMWTRLEDEYKINQTDKSGGIIRIDNNTLTSYTISNLYSGEDYRYAVRMRAYKNWNGKKLYSSWTDLKIGATIIDNSNLLTQAQKDWVINNTYKSNYWKTHCQKGYEPVCTAYVLNHEPSKYKLWAKKTTDDLSIENYKEFAKDLTNPIDMEGFCENVCRLEYYWVDKGGFSTLYVKIYYNWQ